MRLPLANRAVDVGIFRLVWGLQLRGASGVYCAVCQSVCTETAKASYHLQCLFLYGFVPIIWLRLQIRVLQYDSHPFFFFLLQNEIQDKF